MHRATFLALVLVALIGPGVYGAAPSVESFLLEGQFAAGEEKLQAHLQVNANDDEARFGLGVLQFVRCQERLFQSLHRYGFRDSNPAFAFLTGVRPKVPRNAKPETLTPQAFRQIVQTWLEDLARAEASFAQVNAAEVKLPLHVGLIKIDRVGNGARRETLFEILGQWGVALPAKQSEFLVKFDRGDACWFRGYCHLLSAIGEIILAHDTRPLCDAVAVLFFQKVPGGADFLLEAARDNDLAAEVEMARLLAVLPGLRLEVKEPDRLKRALVHLKTMLAQSRLMWKFVLAETDDDCEWIPNPRQKGVLNVTVNQEMVDCWLQVCGEIEAILDGKLVIPFWGAEANQGINLNLFFTAPRPLDITGWIKTPVLQPYVIIGQQTNAEVWLLMNRVYHGHIFSYSFWFN